MNTKRGGVLVEIAKIVDEPALDISNFLPSSEPSPRLSSTANSGVKNTGGGQSENDFGFVLNRLNYFFGTSKFDSIKSALEIELTSRAKDRGKRGPAGYARRTVDADLQEIVAPIPFL